VASLVPPRDLGQTEVMTTPGPLGRVSETEVTQLPTTTGRRHRWPPDEGTKRWETVMSSRSWLAVGLAAATLVVFAVVIAMGGALNAGLAPWPGIGVAVLAVAAFSASRKSRSFLVAGMLGASGVVGVVYALTQTNFLMAASFPGPIFGVILGLPILGLAVAEAVGASRRRRTE
jgi:hypothetical protein